MTGIRGVFIVFEGPEGSGKSTQTANLANRLAERGNPVIHTREPGGTEIAESIRRVILDESSDEMLPETEALLYSAARSEHVGRLISPALARGDWVVCDRFTGSTIAYQGGGHGLSIGALRRMQEFVTRGVEPDLVILLDLPVEVGLRRRHSQSAQVNRVDRAAIEFHQRVRDAYRSLAETTAGTWIVLDAMKSAEEIARDVVQMVDDRFRAAGRSPLPAERRS